MSEFEVLDPIAHLRNQLKVLLLRCGLTLRRFAETAIVGNGIPRDFWMKRNRPGPQRTRSLAYAIDVWRALVDLERALRDSNPSEATQLSSTLKALTDHVAMRIDEAERFADEFDGHDGTAALLLSDDILGTFSISAAASVLRAECVSERFEHTPSYVAGHVLFAELKRARQRAGAHAGSALTERAPRLGLVVDAVDAVLDFTDHLELRRKTFLGIARDLSRLNAITAALDLVNKGQAAESDIPECQLVAARRAIARVICAKLLTNFHQAQCLICATRTLFQNWAQAVGYFVAQPGNRWPRAWGDAPEQIDTSTHPLRTLVEILKRTTMLPSSDECLNAVTAACGADGKPDPGAQPTSPDPYGLESAKERLENQDFIRQKADRFARRASDLTGGIFDSLGKALDHGQWSDVKNVDKNQRALVELHRRWGPPAFPRKALHQKQKVRQVLQRLRFDDLQVHTGPMLGHLSRLRFLGQLFVEHARSLRAHKNRIHSDDRDGDRARIVERFKRFVRHYVSDTDLECVQEVDFAGLLKVLGKSEAGKSTLDWWKQHHNAYLYNPDLNKESWIALRDQSRDAVSGFIRNVEQAIRPTAEQPTAELFADAFRWAADGGDSQGNPGVAASFKASADRIRRYLAEHVSWCSHHAKELLLERTKGGEEYVDPIEIAAGLFLSARMNEPWSEELEIAALRALEETQRRDGGFHVYAPLTQNSGLLYYAPSVQTIGFVFEYLAMTTKRFTEPMAAARLSRWEAFILRAGRFVVESAVRGDPDRDELTGWHSDHHPEPERIDVRVTVQSIRALRGLEVLLERLANRHALAGVKVEYPGSSIAPSDLLPLDCERKEESFAILAHQIIDYVRHHKEPDRVIRSTKPDDPGPHKTLLLYGPPGTGKTTALELIARELDWPVATIGLSAFLADGYDRVGRTAENVFRRLGFVSRCVVVFDEFDAVVPRRAIATNSQLTAAMLPLLSALQGWARINDCLIAFTTNYVERMDPAARRSGRIDKDICICYADYVSRLLVWADYRAVAGNNLHWIASESAASLREFLIRSVWQPPGEFTKLMKKRAAKSLAVRSQDYYGDSGQLIDDDLAREELKRLQAAIGDTIQAEFLANNPGFQALFSNLNDAPNPNSK